MSSALTPKDSCTSRTTFVVVSSSNLSLPHSDAKHLLRLVFYPATVTDASALHQSVSSGERQIFIHYIQ